MDIPLFPLHTVLCPGIAMPLHVFEPRYRLMVERCLERDQGFGVVWIRDGREVGSGELAVATIGTHAEIREADRYADGRFDLVAIGTERFRIEEVFTDREPYLVARVEAIDEEVGDEARAGRLARIATRRFVRYVDQVRELAEEDDEADGADADDDEPVVGLAVAATPSVDDASVADSDLADERTGPPILGIPADPTLLSHLLAGIVELDLPTRQRLLEASTTEARLAALNVTLGREVAYLEQRLRVFVPDPGMSAVRRN